MTLTPTPNAIAQEVGTEKRWLRYRRFSAPFRSPPIPSRRGAPPPAGRSRRRRGIADADYDSISSARSRLRRRVGTRTATSAGPQSVDPRRLRYPSSKRLWLVRRRRARSLQPDGDGSEGASALAADDFASRFAVPCNRRIEADHCLKINPEWTWLRQSNDRRPRQSGRPRSRLQIHDSQ